MDTQPVKVMRIIARLNVGGPALHVALLMEHLDNGAFEQQLIYGQIGEGEGDMSYLLRDDAKTIIIPELGREISPLRDLYTIYKLYRLMRREKPHIVHTHTAKAGFTGRIAAWLARVPIRVHTFHGHVFNGYFGQLKTFVFLWIERFCAWLSNRIITISPKLRDELVNQYRIAPVGKFSVLPLGFDLSGITVSPGEEALASYRDEYGLPDDKQLIFIVGRLVPIKNHDLFLRMAASVLSERNDVHFVIVGDGETRADLEQLVSELRITGHVTFTGWLKDVRLVFHQNGILALTSKNEGTPVSIIEAMAAGMPVVSTEVGGVSDVLEGGRYGVLVPPDDVEALTKALLQILNGEHPNTDEARQSVLARYDIKRLTGELEGLYSELIHGSM